MYKCDFHFYDYNNGHMCKHIHRVHSFIRSVISTEEKESEIIMRPVTE